MNIIVDYDNLNKNDQRYGIEHITEKILHCIFNSTGVIEERTLFRLYGGWYSNTMLTNKANNLIYQIEKSFPKNYNFTKNHNRHSTIIDIELASSLLIDTKRQI